MGMDMSMIFGNGSNCDNKNELYDTKPRLEFDGERLYWHECGIATSWPAYSGTKDIISSKNFSVEAQKMQNYGPIPEGKYLLRPGKYQRYDKVEETIRRTLSNGAWPGGTDAWGEHRIWLEPDGATETWGRSGFSIHGGKYPGSIGCIDLTEYMPEFIDKFKKWGKPMMLDVRYRRKLK